MNTSQARRPSQKPAVIRAAAQRLFLQRGLQQTSMDAVAAEAGTTKQTVYRYFGSKERLFVAVLENLVVDRLHPDLLRVVPAEAWPDDDLEGSLLRIAYKILDHVLDPIYIEMVRILVAEAREFPKLAGLYQAAAIEPVAAALADLIGATLPDDVARHSLVPAALRLYIAPILNYELEALLDDPATVHERARTELPDLVKLVVTAIRPDSGSGAQK